MGKVVLITWVSGSWKTTLVEQLRKELWWEKPINFTTRSPRNDDELDDYVFLTKAQFATKLENGDFAEFTNYNGNNYWISSCLSKEKNYLIILEPIGRTMMEKWLKEHEFNYIKLYIDVTEENIIKRLSGGREEEEDFIKERLKDFSFFSPDDGSIVVDGNWSIEEVLFRVKNIIQ